LRTCLGLTPAEAKLPGSSGAELKAVADELGVTHETARNQLKAVFAKTETHRQPRLVALLARIASTAQTE
jgi:DNA-binding CsgD family transcriptional regulator